MLFVLLSISAVILIGGAVARAVTRRVRYNRDVNRRVAAIAAGEL